MHELAALLPDGVAPRHEVMLASSARSVVRWMASGHLVQLHPGVVVLPDRLADPAIRARAATLWTKGPLSHLSALAVWDVVPGPIHPVHVTVPAHRYPRDSTGVIVHRTTLPPPTTEVQGLPVVHLARSLVDAWAWAHVPTRNPAADRERPMVRQAVIESLRDRWVNVPTLRMESAALRGHAGRAALAELLDLLAGGCESELEIWGVRHVLPGPPDVPVPVQQYRIRLTNGRWVHADAAFPEALVIVELDGAAFHGSRDARERDLRRDSALATLGWVVLRFSYARLINDPEGCRREIIAVVRRRLADR
jgi:hypothetical protein